MRTGTLKDLFGLYEGKPILVIGGGPSVVQDLPRLVELGIKPACVISANSHGMLQNVFPVDYIVHVDRRHAGLNCWMLDHLKPFGKPLICKHTWADYRLPKYSYNANSGLTAVHVAATLGGSPTIVTGLDMFSGGRDYFHDVHGDVIIDHWRGQQRMPRPKTAALKPSYYSYMRAHELRTQSGGAAIRGISGVFTNLFPVFNPAEVVQYASTDYRAQLEKMDCGLYQATTGFQFHSGDRVAEGRVIGLAMDELGAKPVVRVRG